MHQKQKHTVVPTRAKVVEELVPMAGIFPLKKEAKRLERKFAIDQVTSKPTANGNTGVATSSSIQKNRKNENKAKLANRLVLPSLRHVYKCG